MSKELSLPCWTLSTIAPSMRLKIGFFTPSFSGIIPVADRIGGRSFTHLGDDLLSGDNGSFLHFQKNHKLHI